MLKYHKISQSLVDNIPMLIKSHENEKSVSRNQKSLHSDFSTNHSRQFCEPNQFIH